MADQRNASVLSQIPAGTGTPTHICATNADPTTNTPVAEFAYPLATMQALFGTQYDVVSVTGTNVTNFSITTFPTGFDETNVVSVQLRRNSGSQELTVSGFDITTAGTLLVEFGGIMTVDSSFSLVIGYNA